MGLLSPRRRCRHGLFTARRAGDRLRRHGRRGEAHRARAMERSGERRHAPRRRRLRSRARLRARAGTRPALHEVIRLGTGKLTLAQLRAIAREAPPLELDPACRERPRASGAAGGRILASGKPAYGINTGFGRLSQTRIADDELEQLQRNIVLSHAAGTGPLLDDATVRLTLALKIESLARGYSGVRPLLVERLLDLYNRRLYPRIPAKGSVGASRDLALRCGDVGPALEQGRWHAERDRRHAVAPRRRREREVARCLAGEDGDRMLEPLAVGAHRGQRRARRQQLRLRLQHVGLGDDA